MQRDRRNSSPQVRHAAAGAGPDLTLTRRALNLDCSPFYAVLCLKMRRLTLTAYALLTLPWLAAASAPFVLQAGHHPLARALTYDARWCSRALWTFTPTLARCSPVSCISYPLTLRAACRQRPHLRT